VQLALVMDVGKQQAAAAGQESKASAPMVGIEIFSFC
jgi:hypothetical protein